MTGDTCEPVSVSRKIEAPARKLFDFLAHPANHPLIDGSRRPARVTADPDVGGSWHQRARTQYSQVALTVADQARSR